MEKDAAALKQAWERVVSTTQDPNPVAIALGRNFRVNFWEALKAVGEGVHACTAGTRVVATAGADLIAAAELGPAGYGAVLSTIQATTEQMTALEYIACVVLANFPGGVTLDLFDKDLRDFIAHAQGAQLPWYLGVTAKRLEAAATDLALGSTASLLGKLIERKFVVQAGDTYTYVPRNFTWGFKGEG